ncbi:MAG: hypothetical protein IPK72_24525 [Candidatus Eisenbacteria bacterium]|nr:hypothetical protein [Candidatus Eisenbacteria bacterium]
MGIDECGDAGEALCSSAALHFDGNGGGADLDDEEDLSDQSRLPDLAGADHHLDEPSPLSKSDE